MVYIILTFLIIAFSLWCCCKVASEADEIIKRNQEQ